MLDLLDLVTDGLRQHPLVGAVVAAIIIFLAIAIPKELRQ